ncbi:MAG: hypothetical protein GXX99_06730 [Clostridiales bacterium]|nr:hypothetical protein [Clostridiales bacterium]
MGLIGGLTTAAQLAMAPLPNIEPVSLIFLLCGATFGLQTLFAAAVFVLLEGLVFGFGPWWFSYLYLWPLAVLLGALFRRMEGALPWALLSGFYGLAFGTLSALIFLPFGGVALFFSTVLSGIPFDLLHCGGNFAIMLLCYRPLRRLLRRYGPPD